MAGSGKAHLRGADVLLSVEDLVVEYDLGSRRVVHAVSSVSLDVREGETLGLVGESGCGKSSLGRALMVLERSTSGRVTFDGLELTGLSAQRLRSIRHRLHMIFQDPISSLNPRRKVADIVAEGLAITGAPKPWGARVEEVLDAVGLEASLVGERRAHELSGGQCQRVAIARALAIRPKMIVCDEAVSALDVSVQAQILNLLEDMKARYSLSLVFIAHDFAVVGSISDRVAVMYLGKLCEVAPPTELYERPLHPYTRVLVAAVPDLDAVMDLSVGGAPGELPSPLDPPSGCRFRTRCPLVEARCAVEEPLLRPVGADHYVACHVVAPSDHSYPLSINKGP